MTVFYCTRDLERYTNKSIIHTLVVSISEKRIENILIKFNNLSNLIWKLVNFSFYIIDNIINFENFVILSKTERMM